VVTSNVCNNILHPFYKINTFCMVNHRLIKFCILSNILLHSVGLITGVTIFTEFFIILLYPVKL